MLPGVMSQTHPSPLVAARPLAARVGFGVIGLGTEIGAAKRAGMPKHLCFQHMCMYLGMPVAGLRRKGHLQR
jgi:hypothetical protein